MGLKTEYTKSFLKELKKIPSPWRNKIEKVVFKERINFESLDAKKISGFQHYYRIRTGPYRIGMKKLADAVIFMRVLHRKDIYRKFP